MKINTMIEFKNFLNELDLKNSYTKKSLQDIFKYRDRDFIVELKKRKVVLGSEWISHIQTPQTFYELYIETQSKYDEDTKVLIFETLEALEKVESFLKDNLKFLEKEE